MSLLSFPYPATNGEIYPATPAPGQNQYQFDGPNQTWVLLGKSTGVTPGTYGDANNVGQFTVDTQGRITSASNVPITVASGTVTDVTAGPGLTGGTITTSGTISLDLLYTDGLYLGLSGGTLSGPIFLPDGSPSNPSLSFSSDPDSGWCYDVVLGEMNVISNGQREVAFGNNKTTFYSDVVVSGGFSASISGTFSIFQSGGNLRFYDADNSNYVGFIGPTTVTNNTLWRLPNRDGTSGQVLATNGLGNLSWVTPGGVKLVSPPASSSSPGAYGQVAFASGYFYFYDGTQWLRVTGSTF